MKYLIRNNKKLIKIIIIILELILLLQLKIFIYLEKFNQKYLNSKDYKISHLFSLKKNENEIIFHNKNK